MTAAPGSAEVLALADHLDRIVANFLYQNNDTKAVQKAAAALRLAAKPADPDAMNEKRSAEDAQLASNVREATIEECAKAVEVRIKGTDGLPGGNDWGHYAPYNCEVLACAAAIRALSTTGAPKP